MSKVGFWLRGSKGKLGGSYLSKGPGGSTVQHTIGENKNPRTLAQMQQRMIMATAMAAYSGMKEIVDHSFEGVTYGQPTMSEFIRLNAKMLREGLLSGNSSISYNPYQNRNVLPNPYIISKGSLKNIQGVQAIDLNDSIVYVHVAVQGIMEDGTTLRELLNMFGISSKGYITIIAIAYSEEDNISQFGWLRLYPITDYLDSNIWGGEVQDFFEIESNVPVSVDTTFDDSESFEVQFDFDHGNIGYASAGVITSDKQLTWKRSSSIMTVFDEDVVYPASTALATYPIGGDYILNGGQV